MAHAVIGVCLRVRVESCLIVKSEDGFFGAVLEMKPEVRNHAVGVGARFVMIDVVAEEVRDGEGEPHAAGRAPCFCLSRWGRRCRQRR